MSFNTRRYLGGVTFNIKDPDSMYGFGAKFRETFLEFGEYATIQLDVFSDGTVVGSFRRVPRAPKQ